MPAKARAEASAAMLPYRALASSSTRRRDTCSREDPDNPHKKLVYAGEMSWGDEPQGQGYQMLKRALAWGFAEALGIR
jgi:hypothetical protein